MKLVDISYWNCIINIGDYMIELISVRHTLPEKAGFVIDRKYGRDDYTFLHFFNSVEIVIDGKIIKTSPHAVILYSPNEPQKFISKEPLVHDWFHFKGEIEGLDLDGFKTNEILYPKNFEIITKLVAEMENEFFSTRPNRQAMLEILIKELFIRIDRNLGEDSGVHNNISADIQEQFRSFRSELFSSLDVNWTVSKMAARLNFSESRFYALYKTIFGISPMADLIRARINSAKNLLLFQNQKIESIATSLGYENTTHFIRQFKSAVGVTPSRYRKSIGKPKDY